MSGGIKQSTPKDLVEREALTSMEEVSQDANLGKTTESPKRVSQGTMEDNQENSLCEKGDKERTDTEAAASNEDPAKNEASKEMSEGASKGLGEGGNVLLEDEAKAKGSSKQITLPNDFSHRTFDREDVYNFGEWITDVAMLFSKSKNMKSEKRRSKDSKIKTKESKSSKKRKAKKELFAAYEKFKDRIPAMFKCLHLNVTCGSAMVQTAVTGESPLASTDQLPHTKDEGSTNRADVQSVSSSMSNVGTEEERGQTKTQSTEDIGGEKGTTKQDKGVPTDVETRGNEQPDESSSDSDLDEGEDPVQYKPEPAKESADGRDEEIMQLKRTLKEYSTRLAVEMNAKVSADESSIENISIKDRPMNIADEYSMMQGVEWLAAKEDLDEKKIPEVESIKFLCQVIEVANGKAHELHHTMMENMNQSLIKQCNPEEYPLGSKTLPRSIPKPKPGKMKRQNTVDEIDLHNPPPTEFSNVIGDYLRKSSSEAKLGQMFQSVKAEIKNKENKTYKAVKDCTSFQTYLEKVCRLVWKMAIQRPPMDLDFEAKRKGDKMQELHWNSKETGDVTVVFPILKHGGNLMVKGKILLTN